MQLRCHRALLAAGSLGLFVMAGCHSKYVETTIVNETGAPLSVIQVEYPSASFGVQTLLAGANFHYRFKVYGTKELKLTYFDANSQEHHQSGPVLSEGEEGTLNITFHAQDHADFQTRLHP